MAQSGIYTLPNLLTFGRIAIIPVIFAFALVGPLWCTIVSLVIYIIGAVTDFLDGFLARKWSQESRIGAVFDPVADKLFVVSMLVLVLALGSINSWHVFAVLIILAREFIVSGLREAIVGAKLAIPVTNLSKWKTGVQMTAIGVLLFAAGVGVPVIFNWLGLLLLWIAAALTLYTGYQHVRVGLPYLKDSGQNGSEEDR